MQWDQPEVNRSDSRRNARLPAGRVSLVRGRRPAISLSGSGAARSSNWTMPSALLIDRLAGGEVPARRAGRATGRRRHGFARRRRVDRRDVSVARDRDGETRPPHRSQNPPADFPLQTLVMNLTNQCNLSCQYCYEFGEDKVATPEGKPKFMDFETAQASVDFLLEQSAGTPRDSHHVLRRRNADELSAAEAGGGVTRTSRPPRRAARIDFSLTTNATLLTPAIIEFLSENSIGVTVSMDGPKELHDKLRVFANGRGSYDIIEPRVRALIENHRTRPITARVTLTSGVTDVRADLPPSEARSRVSMRSDSRRSPRRRIGCTRSTSAAWTACSISSTLSPTSIWNTRCAARCTDSPTSATRSPNCIRASTNRIRAARAWDWWASDLRAISRPAIVSSIPITHALGHVSTRHRSRQAERFSVARPHQCEIRLPHLLGASAVRRRLPSRSVRALRRHRASESALLRLDSRLDRYLSAHLRRDRRPESRIS